MTATEGPGVCCRPLVADYHTTLRFSEPEKKPSLFLKQYKGSILGFNSCHISSLSSVFPWKLHDKMSIRHFIRSLKLLLGFCCVVFVYSEPFFLPSVITEWVDSVASLPGFKSGHTLL